MKASAKHLANSTEFGKGLTEEVASEVDLKDSWSRKGKAMTIKLFWCLENE